MRVFFRALPALLCFLSLRADPGYSVRGKVELGEWPPEPKAGNRYLRGPTAPAPVVKRDRFALVWLELPSGSFPAPAASPPPEKYVILQENLEFNPHQLCVPVGAKVSFPNEDEVHHNVFSYSPAKKFDLGRYLRGETAPTVTFDRPGEIRLFCEVHKHMRASIFVVDTPFRTRSGPDGGFELAGVPAGSYVLRAVVDERVRHAMPLTIAPGMQPMELLLALPKTAAP